MLHVRRSSSRERNRFLSAIMTHLPGAWIQPSSRDLISLYRTRYAMAMDEQKYDAALIFLNKILELDKLDLEARLEKGDLLHRHLHDFNKAVEQYNKVIRLSANMDSNEVYDRARSSLSELMELFS